MTAASLAFRSYEFWLAYYRRVWRGSVVSSIVNPVFYLAALGAGLGVDAVTQRELSVVAPAPAFLGDPLGALVHRLGALGTDRQDLLHALADDAVLPVVAALTWQQFRFGLAGDIAVFQGARVHPCPHLGSL